VALSGIGIFVLEGDGPMGEDAFASSVPRKGWALQAAVVNPR
jgi:hypothetical protein